MNVELVLKEKLNFSKSDLPVIIESYTENIKEIYFGYNYIFRDTNNVVNNDGKYNARYAKRIKKEKLDNLHHPLKITSQLTQFVKERFKISAPTQEDFDLVEIINIHGSSLTSIKTVNSETENQSKIVGLKRVKNKADLVIIMNSDNPMISLINCLKKQTAKGSAIVQFSESLFTTFGAKLLMIFASLYQKIICIKPKTSSLRNTGFYVICLKMVSEAPLQIAIFEKLNKNMKNIISQRKFINDLGTNLSQINKVFNKLKNNKHDFVKGIVAFNTTFETIRYREMAEFERFLRNFELSKKNRMIGIGYKATTSIIEQWS